MGADDWIALLFFARQQREAIAAITVSGNGLSHCPAGRDNAASLLRLSGPKAPMPPIGCGSNQPLDGFVSYPQLWRQGSDQMMEQRLPATTKAVIDADLDSTALLARTLRQAKQPMRILTIGTMSNLARVLTAESVLKSKIAEVVSMAGAVDVPENVRVHGFTEGNPNGKAEWNLYIDPVAAEIVFSAGLPIRLVPLDATNKVPLTRAFVDRFRRETVGADANVVSNWFAQLLKPELGEYFHWVPMAAVLALRPELCQRLETRNLRVMASTDPDQRSQPFEEASKQSVLNWQGQQRRILDRKAAGALINDSRSQPVRVCLKADGAAVEETLIQAFTSKGPPRP
jgi:pyrimidine-specific ribonucleoside hydrolase